MKAIKMSSPNESINCSVNTCYFYTQGDKCSADKIKVEPMNAADEQQTDCSTFTKKD